ncbi:hypothetical protein AVEN_178250-1 [Araneus ventricosus]|uniref:Uncharacterized protein n=1 Tax=Araneus ventricosus TaxID=182803 RepID=A0A4Y2HB16_ARAVE|nr:hypothetical protein AVEN_57625-1 [Araneus ventricosus]GBM62492.1 hypothetical protein AVEN_178250-1 [Araneus ventricosus]
MTPKLFTIDELNEDKLPGANLSNDEGVIPHFFKNAMDSIEELRTFFFCQKDSEKTFNDTFMLLYLTFQRARLQKFSNKRDSSYPVFLFGVKTV